MDLELFLLRLGQPRDLLDGAAGAPAGLWDERRDGGWAMRHRCLSGLASLRGAVGGVDAV